MSREDIARGALGRGLGYNDRSIDVHISSLRKKLGKHYSGTERIRTIRGWGYLYAQRPSSFEARRVFSAVGFDQSETAFSL